MNPPKWAQELTLNTILYLQSTHYAELELPRLTWRHANRKCSSGISWHDRSKGINVNAGSDRVDTKMVLLHELFRVAFKMSVKDGVFKSKPSFNCCHLEGERELAHWARPPKEFHSDAFWNLAWELFRWAKLPIRYCKTREGNYRKGSIAAYHRSVKQSR